MIGDLLLVLAGGLFLWLEIRGLITSELLTTEREESPFMFWVQVIAYGLLGLGFIWSGLRALIRG